MLQSSSNAVLVAYSDAANFCSFQSPVGQVRQAVKDAIDAGYRHIDCAYVYENEHEVGEGISEKIAEGVIKREDVFVTSKLWNNFHDPKLVREAFDITLKNLKLDYLDLYLIHWPIGYEPSRTELFPKKADGSPAHTNFDLVDTYHALEELVDAGLTKSIGVSNFSIKQITRIVEAARIKPVVNQFECHPYLLNKALREYCKNNNVVVTAYSPLGSPGRNVSEQYKLRLITSSTRNFVPIILLLCHATVAEIV